MNTPSLERPVLIGGTGRSGTTIAARTLNHHPALATTRVRELRFITGTGGLIESLGSTLEYGTSGDPDPEGFAKRLRGRFFRWRKPSGVFEGLHRIIDESVLDAALDDFLSQFDANPVAAARTLIVDIMASALGAQSKCRWIDSTPSNVTRAQALHALMPQAQIVHMMRDGRDVAVSFASKNFGPDDPGTALDLWGQRMLLALEQEEGIPRDTILRIDLADWVAPDALDSLRRLCGFLQLTSDPRFETWFSTNVSAEAMHQGRWRLDLSARQARDLTLKYEDWCAAIRERFPDVTLPRST